MATTGFTKNFVVKNGITTGSITLDATTGNISGSNASLTANLSVSGVSTLGPVGNVKITGGSSGYIISTDGSGNLNFINPSATQSPAPMPTFIPVDDAITIPADYQGLFAYPITIDGTMTVEGVLIDVSGGGSTGNTLPGGSNTQVQFNDANSFGGNTGFTFNKTTGLLTSPFVAGNGNGLSNIQGANVSGAVSYATTANSVALANVSGAGNIASINLDGSTSNVLYGNGVFASVPAAYGNSNVATFLASYGSNAITTTGNVSVGNIIGNGQALTSIAGANVSGTVANATFALDAGNATSATTAGTVTTNAQPNITSVGSLTGLTVSNATGVINFTNTANVALGAVANLHITGGSAGQVLSTDGIGNLSWTPNNGNLEITSPMPFLINTGETYYVTNDHQGLFGIPIEIDGTLQVDGVLVDVSGGGGSNTTVIAGGNTGAATLTPNVASGTIFNYTLTGNITINALGSAVAGSSAVLILTQDATGNRTLTSTMKFAGNSKTLSTAASSIDIMTVFYDGTTYYSTLSQGYA